jgi:hypothetical protein
MSIQRIIGIVAPCAIYLKTPLISQADAIDTHHHAT